MAKNYYLSFNELVVAIFNARNQFMHAAVYFPYSKSSALQAVGTWCAQAGDLSPPASCCLCGVTVGELPRGPVWFPSSRIHCLVLLQYLTAQLNPCGPLSSSQLCGVSYVSYKNGELSFNVRAHLGS